MKLRIVPVVVSIVISSVVLFGGWFAYQGMAMKNPLDKVLHATPNVERSHINIQNNAVLLELQLNPEASLRETIHYIKKEGASAIGSKELKVDVRNDSNEALDHWWSSVLFQVAQAMETRQYADIPTSLEQEAVKLDGLQVFTEMDEENVYVRLVLGEDSKYVILPRIPQQMGVWTP